MSRYSDLLISQSVTHYWPLDDVSGSTAVAAVGGLNLTQAGAVVEGAPAVVGTGFVFSGSANSSYSSVSTSAMAFNSANGYSASWIMRCDQTMSGSGAWGIVSRRANSSLGRTFSAFMQGGTGGSINIDYGNNQIRWDSGFIPTQGAYFHVATTWTPGGTYRLYVNGVQYSSTGGQAPTTTAANGPFFIGALGASPTSQLFPGLIDEVAVWNNKTLSADEIKAQYATAFPITRLFDGTNWNDADVRTL